MAERTIHFDELLLSIHTAALAADGWTRVLSDVAQAVSAEGASLVRPTYPATVKPFARLLGRDASYARDYQNHWAQHDCLYEGAVRNRRTAVGMVNVDGQLVEQRDFERSPFFQDFLRRFDIEKMMNVCLTAPDPSGIYGPVALSLYRGLGKESFSPTQTNLLSRLAPHLAVAARNYWAAQSLQLLTEARSNALDAVAAAALNRVSSGLGCEVSMTDLATGAQAQVSMAPLPIDTDFGFLPTLPCSLVWITPLAPRQDVGRDMAQLFDLTPAERRVLDRLIAGDDLLAAAASLRISIHTARTQLKSIFRKTGRRSQGQLLMLAARIATLSPHRG